MSIELLLLAGLVVAVATVFGVVAGIGGAVVVVPGLLLLGLESVEAASVGLLATAVASTAAASRQVEARLANHRLAVVIELGAVAGAVGGALFASHLSPQQFRLLLAAAVIVAAATTVGRMGMRNRPDSGLDDNDVGEHVGGLSGAYPLGGQVVAYRARRVPTGLTGSVVIGALAGMTGTSGGYLKTPLMSEVMHVPSKVAAATTTFASGITAGAALVVYLGQGALDPGLGAAAVLAASVGGYVGARLQSIASPLVLRRLLGLLLTIIAGVLLWPM